MLEILLKLYALGIRECLFSISNFLDIFIIVISFTSAVLVMSTTQTYILSKVKVLRILRVLRPLRLISYYKSLKVTLNSFIKSIRSLIHITGFILVFFLVFSIIGIIVFKGSFFYCDGVDTQVVHDLVFTKFDCMDFGGNWVNQILNFDNIGQALMSLYVVSTTDGWTELMTMGIDSVNIDY